MFGDIITDLVSVLAGGMGMAPSGQINGWSTKSHGMFEPIHGSAPDIAGKNVANPIGTILAVSMMFNWLAKKKNSTDFSKAGEAIENAVQSFLLERKNLPVDLGGGGKTTKIGSRITELLDSGKI
jgi:isocitrate/isopropylmalate dehydrogenase